MTRRLAAAIAGGVLIVGMLVSYSRGERPMVAGSNTVAPLYAAVEVPSGTERCQLIPRVPAKANRVRVSLSSAEGANGSLGVTLMEQAGVNAQGTTDRLQPGPLGIRLNRVTRAAHPARICFTYSGDGRVVLAGEEKRTKASPGATAEKHRVASVVFMRPGEVSLASTAGVIADRFAEAQPGAFRGWALWFAGALLVSAAALTFWWLIFRIERPVK